VRWKLLRRRYSISSPRMTVRSHLPWPLRWVFVALMFGFSAASALWAFEFGQVIAGIDSADAGELARLRVEVALLRTERDKVRGMAGSADSLLRAEQAAQQRLAQQIRQIEAENLALKADLGFFERLLPAIGEGMNVRGLHAEVETPGQLRYQLLVMQPGKSTSFSGVYELQLAGTLDGRPWTYTLPEGGRRLQFRQYGRVEGLLDHPAEAVVESIQVKVMDDSGGVRAKQTVKL
jgi:hypothetical protein